MKILNILTSPLCYDGISMSVMSYFRYIDNKKIKIDFLVPSAEEKLKNEINNRKSKIYFLNMRKKHPIKYINQLSKIIKENKYDIIQAHGSSAILCLEMIAGKIAGCKIRIAHSHNTKTEHRILDKILRPIFYRTFTHGFACGKEAGKWLFKNRKFEIINNGKEIEEYAFNEEIRRKIRKEYNLENDIVIGHIGTFNYQKNHDYLLDIFYELTKNEQNTYKLVLIGDGRLRENIEEKAKKLEIYDDVIFLGKIQEVSKWLQAMDLIVFPSRYEGFPIVLIESQIAGLPCIVSDKITKEVQLTNLVKFISIDDKPEKWTKEIKKITIEERNKNKLEIISQIRNRGFDIKENAKSLEKIYTDLIEGEN